MMNLNAISYCVGYDNCVEDWNCTYCQKYDDITDITEITTSSWNPYSMYVNLSGFVAFNKTSQSVLIIFSGTRNTQGWIVDTTFPQITYTPQNGNSCSKCKVHSGFYNAYYNHFRNRIMRAIKKIGANYSTPYHISGHSLGGALSTICALDFAENGYNVPYLYTFGSPRIGNKNFAKYVKTTLNESYRVTHYRDLIVHLPFRRTVGYGFYHAAHEIYYNTTEGYEHKICNDSIEDNQCSYSMDCEDWNRLDHLYYMGINLSNADICDRCPSYHRKSSSNNFAHFIINNVLTICKQTNNATQTLEKNTVYICLFQTNNDSSYDKNDITNMFTILTQSDMNDIDSKYDSGACVAVNADQILNELDITSGGSYHSLLFCILYIFSVLVVLL